MAKICAEICIISARGLRRSSALWKLQWFAVGWIDPKSKYCTKIDTSGSTNPTWRTKFSALIDNSDAKWQGLALHIELYSRDAIFLRENLQGTAVVVLKEFLAKHKSDASNNGVEQVGSFQLRKKTSGKVQGLVDISIRISDKDGSDNDISSYPGNEEGFQLKDEGNGISLGTGNGSFSSQSHNQTENYTQPQTQMSSVYDPRPNFYGKQSSVGDPNYRPPRTPPPPPPPSHVGYLPTFLPRTDQLAGTWVNLPPSSSAGTAAGRTSGPNFAAGMGAGALAAGAVIFGDDFMSGFELPTLQDPSLIISIDSPF
ncbi:hypothetical protein IFM89_005313 [Coptis chinensis]|uniref:C2 domain-containing protein n=1 Tax=Coptis chinensis TaxID=261450 RepID=A0A835HCJ7_9MAGN|nr:hypothetical protein IFM89_005313 [Coptis chinensis]